LLREMGYRTVDALADLGTTGRNGLRRGERNKAAGRRKGSKGGGVRNAPKRKLQSIVSQCELGYGLPKAATKSIGLTRKGLGCIV
jgi:hypothetical protein